MEKLYEDTLKKGTWLIKEYGIDPRITKTLKNDMDRFHQDYGRVMDKYNQKVQGK